MRIKTIVLSSLAFWFIPTTASVAADPVGRADPATILFETVTNTPTECNIVRSTTEYLRNCTYNGSRGEFSGPRGTPKPEREKPAPEPNKPSKPEKPNPPTKPEPPKEPPKEPPSCKGDCNPDPEPEPEPDDCGNGTPKPDHHSHHGKDKDSKHGKDRGHGKDKGGHNKGGHGKGRK